MPIPAPLAPLAQYRQFIPVLVVPKEGKPGKTDKFPVDPFTGRVGVDAHDPRIWQSYDEAATVATRFGSCGVVGFVLTRNDPFFCLDIDGAATAAGWSPLATSLCAQMPGTAIEVSYSGVGLHIWGQGVIGEHSKKNIPLGIELYTELRFIALGHSATGHAGVCPTLGQIAAAYFPEKIADRSVPEEGPCEEWRGPTDDADLLRRALKSQSTRAMFGTGASFSDLFDANAGVLSKAYPATGEGEYDASSADAALAQHLAFWTGRDVARIERLMRQSSLVRSKWDDRDDYLVERTIKGACARQVQVLQDKAPEPGPAAQMLAPVPTPQPAPVGPPVSPAEAPAPTYAQPQSVGTRIHNEVPTQRAVNGTTFLPASAQVELFRGCVYVVDLHRILVPGGKLLKEGNFKAKYGGYTFAMDASNERTSRNAWEAFTESQVLRCPQSDGTCFRPDLAPGAILHEAGRSRVNVWWPAPVECKEGDATPILDHVARLLPVKRDQLILLSYMAACVQYPGKKFSWAPVIQGVEGNGKTMLSKCLSEALGRHYTHWPKANKLGGQFNSWLFGNLLYCVEDIHTDEFTQAAIMEQLKPMITGGDGIEIEGKGLDQVSTEICGNFIFNTNHKSALRKSRNDRRIAPLYCAQQEEADLIRDGMPPDYHIRMWNWLKAGGYAIVTNWLRTWPIPDEFNPATSCHRAPRTSSTDNAINMSLGRIEQEVMEHVEQGAVGFAGGWISSMALDRLLEHMGKAGAMPINKRADMLKELGYKKHPMLPNGRVNNVIAPDGGRPMLYLAPGHEAFALIDAGAIAKAYANAQGVGGTK